MTQRKIEIFSAGCPVCKNAIETVERLACSSCDIEVLDMNDASSAQRADALGVKRVPAVVVDGKLLDCCTSGAVEEAVLRAAGIGSPVS